jgi:hypothetical protein
LFVVKREHSAAPFGITMTCIISEGEAIGPAKNRRVNSANGLELLAPPALADAVVLLPSRFRLF